MCGRYSALTEDEIIEVRSIIQEVSMRLVKDDMDNYVAPMHEIRPTDKAPIVTKVSDGIAFESGKFGFKSWDGKGVIINARSETVTEKGMFAKHINTGRCVVPAGEYYEWREHSDADADTSKKSKSKTKKRKYFITDREGNMLFFAGLYRDYDGEREFVIITKEASGAVTEVHDRMPVILRVDQLEAWLSGVMTPDELGNMDFGNTAIAPIEEPQSDAGKDEDGGQISLF